MSHNVAFQVKIIFVFFPQFPCLVCISVVMFSLLIIVAFQIVVAFPDDGAWKRFHKQLDHFPMVSLIFCLKRELNLLSLPNLTFVNWVLFTGRLCVTRFVKAIRG